MKFSQRSMQMELLDGDHIPFPDIEQNMKELNFINTWLGGHAITISGLKKLIAERKIISVCEIGCGGGDNLAAIYKWANQQNIQVQLTGIDIKDECIAFAKQQTHLPATTRFITSDYKAVEFDTLPDVIFSSLFCHHFSGQQLAEQFSWMKKNCRVGFFVNDLQRHWLAYYSIKLLSAVFSSSYLVKHDAPLSVLRGFVKKEWEAICRQANVWPLYVKWKWAFRFLLVYKHG